MEAATCARNLCDAALEATVFLSFSRVGFVARQNLFHWGEETPTDLSGRVAIVTGATSGIGLATAMQLARYGCEVWIIGRNRERTKRAADAIGFATGADVGFGLADMGEPDQVKAVATEFRETHNRLDILINNAGALSTSFTVNSANVEATVASQVVGPFLLTTELLPLLEATRDSRVLTVSSGGMYSEPLSLDRLQMTRSDYRGTAAYARAKRAQVALTEEWAAQTAGKGITFHAMHPGWADTPGVSKSLPRFRSALAPFLRSPAEGADTLVWLASSQEPLQTNGKFWHDRRQRGTAYVPGTRMSQQEKSWLWDWCRSATSGCCEPRRSTVLDF